MYRHKHFTKLKPSDVGHFNLKGYNMYFVKFLTVLCLALTSIVFAATVIFVSQGILTPDWLFIGIPYIGVCLLSIWAAD